MSFSHVLARRAASISLVLAFTWCWLGVPSSFAGEPPNPDIVMLLDSLAFVSGDDEQPGGPSHHFLIGRFEITNDQFVSFLNDAIANPGQPSGAYVYVHAASGDVCVNGSAGGAIGMTPCAEESLMFRPSVGGRITWNGSIYTVVTTPPGYGEHPVVGVTWYGAVKFCNWLTLQAGLPAAERIYVEAASGNLSMWRPVTISAAAWGSRDLTSDERVALLQYRGFRLPMDGGPGNPNPFNEWYKAAAGFGDPVAFDAVYGFGRNTILPADGNIACSGDPFDDPVNCALGGTTPVGFYDGVNLLADGLTGTRDTNNAYGLYDMTGNVWEWVQGRVVNEVGDRRTRGVSFLSSAGFSSLTFDTLRFAESAEKNVGFRVARSVPHALLLAPVGGLTVEGVWGGPYAVSRTVDEQLVGGEILVSATNEIDRQVGISFETDRQWLKLNHLTANVLAPGEESLARFVLEPECDESLGVGQHQASILATNEADGSVTTLPVALDLQEPLTILPDSNIVVNRPYQDTLQVQEFMVSNVSREPVELRVLALAPNSAIPLDWVVVGGQPSGGIATIDGDTEVTLAVAIDIAALEASLDEPELPVAGTFSFRLVFTDGCTGEEWERNVTVTIERIVSINANEPLLFTGPVGGEAGPPELVLIVNNLLDESVEWSVSLESVEVGQRANWLRVAPTSGLLPAGQDAALNLETTSAVGRLAEGLYEILVTIAAGDYETSVIVRLDVTSLSVEPDEGIVFSGLRGGPFTPASAAYEVRNAGLLPLEWRAVAAVDCDVEPRVPIYWLNISPAEGVIELPQGVLNVTLSPDPDVAPLLPQGIYRGELCVESYDSSMQGDIVLASEARSVTLEVGSDPRFDTVEVPSLDVQVGGPDYSFRVSRNEVTNDLYVAFLNDALANLGNRRGAYMFFDEGTGAVFVNDGESGELGEPNDAVSIKMFDPSINTAIRFEEGFYSVRTAPVDYRKHPVTGVSWYGAVKYCNWLTLEAGFPENQRVYGEGTTEALSSWRPVSISPEDWNTRSLSNTEFASLTGLWGFRLPWDRPDNMPGTYNEWHKFAPATLVSGGLTFDAAYGFGRDTIGNADANSRCSRDPFEDVLKCQVGGTTPVGYYDGVQPLIDGITNSSANAYGLNDVSGNVWELMQGDTGAGPRYARGGSYARFSDFLHVNSSIDRLTSMPDVSTGFRVVRSLPATLRVEPFSDTVGNGVWGGPLDGLDGAVEFLVSNETDRNVTYEVVASVPWMTMQGMVAGTLEGRTAATMNAAIEFPCDGTVPPGTRTGKVRVFDLDEDVETVRNITLNLSEPLSISPATSFSAEREFGGPSPSRTYMLRNDSAIPVTVSAEAADPELPGGPALWVFIDGQAGLNAWTLQPGELREVDVILAVPFLNTGVHLATVNFLNECTGTSFARSHQLEILPLFEVDADVDAVFTGGIGGPFMPEVISVTIRNLVDRQIDWNVSFAPIEPSDDATWIAADPSSGTLDIDDEVTLELATTSSAATLPPDVYAATITFESSGGFRREFVVGLNVAQLLLSPEEGAIFTGPRSGPFSPVDVRYTLANPEFEDLEWRAEILEDCEAETPEPADWLKVEPASGVIGVSGESAELTVSVTNVAFSLVPGEYTAYLCVSQIDPLDPEGGALTTASRRMELALGTASFSVPMVVVDEEPAPFEGPHHRFRIGRTEVANADYARFLNDIEEDGGLSAKSFFVSRDTASGSLTIPDGTVLFETKSDQPESRIAYDSAATLGARYTADIKFADHPVTFVSWYGAVKYCNWLTHVQGMPDQIVYDEGAFASDWRPVSDEPAAIVGRFGFRLPMDGGEETAGLYNEWYKVAAARFDEEFDIEFDAVYGFGRNSIAGADANFAASGDPFTGGTTPAAFYNGMIYNAGGDGLIGNGTEFASMPNTNGYGVFDLTGNVSEWMHGAEPQHVVRGGNINSAAASDRLKVSSRAVFAPQSSSRSIGFRIAQSIPETIAELSVVRNEPVYRLSGFVGGPMGFVSDGADQAVTSLMIRNDGALAIDDIAVTLSPANGPVQFAGATPQIVPAVDGVMLNLRIDETRTETSVASPPPGDFTRVSGERTPPNGPQHDFWINRNEVTNSGMAAFLNDLIDNLLADADDRDARSAFIYVNLNDGSVFIHDEEEGRVGLGPPAKGIPLYDMSCGDMTFDGDSYATVPARNSWPARCISWYGAVKYCNWLSRGDGIPPSLWAYDEADATNPDGWKPAGIPTSDWTNGPAESILADYLNRTLGYRLPMDAGAPGHSSFNEWFKVAAWHETTEQNSLFSFGRDELTAKDANYFNNGDTEDEGPTPVGFFNGTNTLVTPPATCETEQATAESTNAGANGYGINDMTGNVAEWMQDRDPQSAEHGVRGGSWSSPSDDPLLRADGRATAAPGTISHDRGFRLVRNTGSVLTVEVQNRITGQSSKTEYLVDLREPFLTVPRDELRVEGVYGEDFNVIEATYETSNRSNTIMGFELAEAVDWLDTQLPGTEELQMEVDGLESLLWYVSSNDAINTLPPGEHSTTLLVRNTTTGVARTRRIVIDIEEPFDVAPAVGQSDVPSFAGLPGGPFVLESKDGNGGQAVFTLTNTSDIPLAYAVASTASWLTVDAVEAVDDLSGPLAVGESISFKAFPASQADSLGVGIRTADVMFTLTDPVNPVMNSQTSHAIRLEVQNPVTIERSCEPCDACGSWRILPDGMADTLCTESWLLTNVATGTQAQRELSIEVDQEWLSVDVTLLDILPGEENAVSVEVSATEEAFRMHQGEYTAVVTVTDVESGASQCREITLDVVETLATNPFDAFSVRGIAGRQPQPALKVYSLANVDTAQVPLDWTACTGADWLRLDGAGEPCTTGMTECAAGSARCGTLEPGQVVQLVVSIGTISNAGMFSTSLFVRDESNMFTISREVQAELVTPVVIQDAELPVSKTAPQPDGPGYDFAMDAYAVTNAKFVAFLNDAMNRPNEEAGQFLYFDTDSGDVYINTIQQGQAGNGNGGREVRAFSPEIAQQIAWDGNAFAVVADEEDYANHPVTGVSWYGALKYCNWLTLDQGMFPEDRCYGEGTAQELHKWRPLTISPAVWATRDLNDTERMQLVTTYHGYRLPMDDGALNNPATSDEADQFNEWFKAAAWNTQLSRNTDYGMGIDLADEIDGSFANFRCSGDRFESDDDCNVGGTTPVGFYDGKQLLEDGTPTVDTNNQFGLYDMSGNVFEWMQDKFEDGADSTRAMRGGSFRWEETQLVTRNRTWKGAGAVQNDIGFRVIRVQPSTAGDVDGNALLNLVDHAAFAGCIGGPGSMLVADVCGLFDLAFGADQDVDLSDFAAFQNAFGESL